MRETTTLDRLDGILMHEKPAAMSTQPKPPPYPKPPRPPAEPPRPHPGASMLCAALALIAVPTVAAAQQDPTSGGAKER